MSPGALAGGGRSDEGVRARATDPALKRRVHLRLLAEPLLSPLDVPGALGEVRDRLAELLRREDPLLPTARFEQLLGELVDEVAGLGPLEPLLADERVTEVMINGPGRVYVERDGVLSRVPLDIEAAGIVRLVERVIAPLGLRLDRASPLVEARLADGSRLHAVVPPLAIDGPCVTIRRFGVRDVPLDAFDVSTGAAAFLRWAVAYGANVVVSGGTSAGKTTLVNALARFVPTDDRVVTVEETAELRLPLPHVVRLESRPANAEGAGAVSVRQLVRAALRMRPDRIVVGEVRGGEALDMVQALNTGHDGSFSTVHATGADTVLARLETLVLLAGSGLPLDAVRAQLASALDVLVHVERRGGRRRIVTIAEVSSARGREPVAVPLFARRGSALVPVGRPSRPPRRADAPRPDPEWFGC